MTLSVQHVRLGNADDRDGVLVYDGEALVAVLAKLTGEHGELAGRWFIECVFGLELKGDDIFSDLPDACGWIEDRIMERNAAQAAMRPKGRQ